MPVTIHAQQGTVTAVLSGEIDHHGARAMLTTLEEAVSTLLPKHLTLDLSGITFMDSSGIGLVMGRYRLMRELGGELRVTGVPSHIKKVMRLSGLDKLAVLEPDSIPKETRK